MTRRSSAARSYCARINIPVSGQASWCARLDLDRPHSSAFTRLAARPSKPYEAQFWTGAELAVVDRDNQRLLREELRETLALAWPLVLTNFTQALIPATDVVLLGWAGKDKLAAASLGVNLVNGCMIFGVGVVMASAPMIARAIGHRERSLHETRRTVRQSM